MRVWQRLLLSRRRLVGRPKIASPLDETIDDAEARKFRANDGEVDGRIAGKRQQGAMSSARIGTFSACSAVPALPGAQYSRESKGL
jgi:hypothetical protein